MSASCPCSAASVAWLASIAACIYLQQQRWGRRSASAALPESSSKAKLLVVTRIHAQQASSLPSPAKVAEFVDSCKAYAADVLVCVGLQSRQADDLAAYRQAVQQSPCKVTFLVVQPWGHFTAALNAAVTFAQDGGFGLVAFQSLEYRTTASTIRALIDQFDCRTLVAGVAMAGHAFAVGSHRLTGRSCPWNTMAVWSTHWLGMTGFPLIGDGPDGDRSAGGVEELAAVSLLQLLRPDLTAWLVDMGGGDSWQTDFADPLRAAWHAQKMASKDARPAAQLDAMGLPAGTVQHVRLG